MKNETNDFWGIKNEHLKNLVVFVFVLLISILAILTSAISLGLFNTLRLLAFAPETESLRDTAVNLINTSNVWNLVNEVWRGVLIILLLKLLGRLFDKSKISLSDLGLHFDLKQLAYLALGIALMGGMFVFSSVLDVGNSATSENLRVTFAQEGLLLLILVALANGFWQEVAFRGFLQKRLIGTYGVIGGIVVTAFLFTILHGLARSIGLIEIVLGTVLFTLVGSIFYLTRSIVFATALHATGNFFLRSFGTNELHIPEQGYRLALFGITLIVVLVVFRRRLFAGKIQEE